MTDNNHPITPPDDLQEQWKQEWLSVRPSFTNFHQWMLAKSAQWGADQELDACCEWLTTKAMAKPWETVPRPVLVTALVLELRAARRPKPPSLKEQALKTLEEAPGPDYPRAMTVLNADQHALIRKALKALPDD